MPFARSRPVPTTKRFRHAALKFAFAEPEVLSQNSCIHSTDPAWQLVERGLLSWKTISRKMVRWWSLKCCGPIWGGLTALCLSEVFVLGAWCFVPRKFDSKTYSFSLK